MKGLLTSPETWRSHLLLSPAKINPDINKKIPVPSAQILRKQAVRRSRVRTFSLSNDFSLSNYDAFTSNRLRKGPYAGSKLCFLERGIGADRTGILI